MIVTAQLFFNELDLLEVKCRELRGVVDLHIVVESPLTFTGLPKPLYFEQNKARFAEFPIVHDIFDLPAEADSPWSREWLSHRRLRNLVNSLKPEIAVWSDCDELMRADTVERFRKTGWDAAVVDMDVNLFFFDRLDTQHPPGAKEKTTARIGKWKAGDDWGPWRGDNLKQFLPDAGWHFEYFGARRGPHLLDKLAAISHAPEEGAMDMASRVRRGEFPGFERTVAYPESKMPASVLANRSQYADHFFLP